IQMPIPGSGRPQNPGYPGPTVPQASLNCQGAGPVRRGKYGDRPMKSWTVLLVAAFVAAGGGAYGQTSPSPWGPHALGQPAATPPAPAPGPSPGWEGCDCPAGPCGEAPCGPPGRFWAEADYLLWWMRGASLPPLVTASPPGTGRRQAGVLG